MRLRGVSFENWLRSQDHRDKSKEERWSRELYPWPVLAQVDCDERLFKRVQNIAVDDADFDVTVLWRKLQGPPHNSFKYRLRIESDGLGWQSRRYSDNFDLCSTPDGMFKTVFHAKKKKEQLLERAYCAFFDSRWQGVDSDRFRNLDVSRYLAASLVDKMVEAVWGQLDYYPSARLVGGASPMFASGEDLWIGYRFYSEGAHAWARKCAGQATRVVSLYFARTKYQFKTDLPEGAEVMSITDLDAMRLDGRYEDLIRVILRGLERPNRVDGLTDLDSIVRGQTPSSTVTVTDADVHEALAALERPCASKAELRYQLAAGVLLNRWIEDERRRGHIKRKKFYAFKETICHVSEWASESGLAGVSVWAEEVDKSKGPVLYVRMDGVDFSYHAIPCARDFLAPESGTPTWSGVRLKPIAPLVLEWARLRLPCRDGELSRNASTITQTERE